MARLEISLLGPFQVALDGRPVQSFETARVRALLAYLAAEAGRPHHRESLAGLLWPERPDNVAMTDLRQALHGVRKAIDDAEADPPFLLITRDTLQLNPSANCRVDVRALQDALEGRTSPGQTEKSEVEKLEAALSFCRGGFLEGFSLRGSPAFDEWLLLKREQVDRQVLTACERLARFYDEHGEYLRGEQYARRQLELDPWLEEAHRQLMRVLARSGRRSEALAHYDECRRLLAQELGAVPSEETRTLYEAIRSGALEHASEQEVKSGRQVKSARLSPGTAHFVAREEELEQLEEHLQAAVAGDGRVVFITGEAGSGKTVLAAEFARRAIAAHAGLVSVGGSCGGPGGSGDPYLPFRNSLQMLTGDMEARRAVGSLSVENGRRLWALLPEAVRSLVDVGPGLIDVFVPAADLAVRAEAVSPPGGSYGAAWRNVLARLGALAERRARSEQWAEMGEIDEGTRPGQQARRTVRRSGERAAQADLFEQYTRVMQVLARRQPLLLVLDDLQWAGSGAINLLFHLGRRLGGNRILLLGLYRPDEVALGRDGGRHPLLATVHELQRLYGDIQVDLGQSPGRHFVNELVDAEPNRLRAEFRERLYRRTGGHALFTVELLRGLQERGDLARDAEGYWVEGQALDWDKVPPRVDAVIAERIGRLPPEWLSVVKVAAVEGEEFTAEVAARVLSLDEREVTGWLSGALSQQHRLVVAQSFRRLDSQREKQQPGQAGQPGQPGQRLSRYRFCHYLFQKYMYSQLDQVERAALHEAVGSALEALHGEPGARELARDLAWHFEQARMLEKAAECLLRAGNEAVRLHAWEQALTDFTRGLALLHALPPSASRAEHESRLQLALADVLFAIGWGSDEQSEAAQQAYDLAHQQRAGAQLFASLYVLAISILGRGEHQKTARLAGELSALAEGEGDPAERLLANFVLGASQIFRAEWVAARAHLEQALALYEQRSTDPDIGAPSGLVVRTGIGPACKGLYAAALCMLGYPERALSHIREAMAMAREVGVPASQAITLLAECEIALVLRQEDVHSSQERAEVMSALVQVGGLTLYQPWADVLAGWAKTMCASEAREEGLVKLRLGVSAWQAGGSQITRPLQLLLLAEACRRAGKIEQAVETAGQALQAIEETGAHAMEADVYRLKGELLLAGAPSRDGSKARRDAEGCFMRALELARQQKARWWELRAATSLARLWREQGKVEQAYDLLAPIYGWFTEGFDLPDLQEAATVLCRLSEPPNLPYCAVTGE